MKHTVRTPARWVGDAGQHLYELLVARGLNREGVESKDMHQLLSRAVHERAPTGVKSVQKIVDWFGDLSPEEEWHFWYTHAIRAGWKIGPKFEEDTNDD